MTWFHTYVPAYGYISVLNVYLHCWNINVSSEKFTFLIPNTKPLFLFLLACFWWMLSILRALWALSDCTHWRTRFLFDFKRSIWYNDLWQSHALLATKSLQEGKAINHLWYNEAWQSPREQLIHHQGTCLGVCFLLRMWLVSWKQHKMRA